MDPKDQREQPASNADEAQQTIELFGERIDASTPCDERPEADRQAVDRIGRAVDAAAERARRREQTRTKR